jgi:diguanylate cyclase
MAGATAVRAASGRDPAQALYQQIGEFLFAQRLAADPANFAFAYNLFTQPGGPLALAVAALTEGGVRLTQRDIDSLGCDLTPAGVAGQANEAKAQADGLVAQTQMQVEGFRDVVTAMRAETEGFGRDLAASAAAISHASATAGGVVEVARITGEMLERVRSAEARLENATREASELREKLEEARDNARRDPLTDLPNRRAFEEAYAAQSAAGERICIAVCDVDHFKSVNDRFGHIVGDRVLKAIASALGDSCPGHLVARYGGEEFALLFTGIEIEAARSLIEGARVAVASKHYRLRESDEPLGAVTFSAGLTVAGPEEGCGTAFHRADRLLYAAKDGGRNQVVLG